MPSLPKKACGYPGCPALTRERYCPTHASQVSAQYDRDRGDDRQFYSTARWRKLRRMKLRRNPMCEVHPDGTAAVAVEVHHVIERKQRPDLAFDFENLQSLCKPCHSRITAREHLHAKGGQ